MVRIFYRLFWTGKCEVLKRFINTKKCANSVTTKGIFFNSCYIMKSSVVTEMWKISCWHQYFSTVIVVKLNYLPNELKLQMAQGWA